MKIVYARAELVFAAFLMFAGMTYASAKPAPSGKKSNEPPGLTVSVIDYAGMPAKDLERAEAYAALIYREAGVRLAWSNLGAADPQPAPHTFVVKIFRRSQLDTEYVANDVAGFTSTNIRVSTMILEIIEDVASKMQLKTSLVLGCTMAHEIGHMLMPGRPHAKNGIMRGRLDRTAWEKAAKGQLFFSVGEPKLLRNQLLNLASTEAAPEGSTDSRR